jgi:ribonucleoside-diphosphate reductase beta chain
VPSFGLINVAGVLPGLCFANKLISHDEALHCDFACVLYNCLLKPPCSIHVREIANSAIQIKECFIREALLFNLMGMNATLMSL